VAFAPCATPAIGMSAKELENRDGAVPPGRDPTPREGSGGTGLGLPLTKAAGREANRARFAIESEKDAGDLGGNYVSAAAQGCDARLGVFNTGCLSIAIGRTTPSEGANRISTDDRSHQR